MGEVARICVFCERGVLVAFIILISAASTRCCFKKEKERSKHFACRRLSSKDFLFRLLLGLMYRDVELQTFRFFSILASTLNTVFIRDRIIEEKEKLMISGLGNWPKKAA